MPNGTNGNGEYATREADRCRLHMVADRSGNIRYIFPPSEPNSLEAYGDPSAILNARTVDGYVAALTRLKPEQRKAIAEKFNHVLSGTREKEPHFDAGMLYHGHFPIVPESGNECVLLAIEDESVLTAGKRERDLLLMQFSHDLKGPISCAVRAMDLALRAYEQGRSDVVLTDMQIAKGSLEGLQDAVEDGLYVTRRLLTGSPPEMETIDLYVPIGQALKRVRTIARSRGVDVDFAHSLHPGQIIVRGDRYYLRSVYYNLLLNAANYANGRVTFGGELHPERNEYELNVYDNGPPIPENLREAIFDVGVKSEESTSGHGFGLAIVRTILDLHGGRVWVANKEDGVDMRFTLPVPPKAEIYAYLEGLKARAAAQNGAASGATNGAAGGAGGAASGAPKP